MNKYISKAMLYNRRLDMVLLCFITLAVSTTSILEFFLSSTNNLSLSNNPLLKLPIFFPMLLIISIAADLYNKKEMKYSYWLSTPMKKSTIIYTNLLIPTLPIAIALFIHGLVVSLIMIFNNYAAFTIGSLWLYILVLFSLLLFINILVQFFQLLINHYIAAIFIPFVYCGVILPFILLFTLSLLQKLFPTLQNFKIPIEFYNFINKLIVSLGIFTTETSINFTTNRTLLPLISFIPILLILSLILVLIIVPINNNIKVENISKIFAFKWVEKLVTVTVSILLSYLLILLLGFIFFKVFILDLQSRILILISIFLITLCSIFFYKIINILFNSTLFECNGRAVK